MCNKANLLNQASFRLGVPGSGKSFSVKEEIAFLLLNTDDDILIRLGVGAIRQPFPP